MENSVVIGEFSSTSTPDELRAAARGLLEKNPGASRVDCYRRLDGDETYDFWLILELWDSQALYDCDARMKSLTASVRSYHEVFRMSRDSWGIAHQQSGSLSTDVVPPSLLTIFLPTPQGRSSEWNQWYDGHHMPTVFSLARGLQIGHRYAPMTPAANGEYLVLYEFPSVAEMGAFQTGGTPDFKKQEYFEIWGVRNNRRAFVLEFVEQQS